MKPATKVSTAVLPVAGLGTRLMPLTLHQPKAMVGIIDRPVIHYVIDEVLTAGIKNIVIVIGPKQKEFKKYIQYLKKCDPEWQKLKIHFDFAIQKMPRGNGEAILCAERFIKKQPFLLCFGDEILAAKESPLKTMLQLFYKTNLPALIVEPVPKKLIPQYGIVKIKDGEILDIVEKPKIKEAPSNLAIIGRYIITPEILPFIKKLAAQTPLDQEIYLADALRLYLKNSGRILGWRFTGQRFDAGSKLGILKAQAYFGIHHKKLGKEFRKFLKRSL